MAPRTWLRPEFWRGDLLRIVLRVTAGLGVFVYVPSAWFSLQTDLVGVFVLDTVAIATVWLMVAFEGRSLFGRTVVTLAVFYSLGVGLLMGVGPISQIYLFGFSLLVTLLLGLRWGMASVALNAVTLLAVGVADRAAPEMAVPGMNMDAMGWTLVSANFVLVNFCVALVLGAVIEALETALARSVEAAESLREGRALLRIAGRTARLGGWRVGVIEPGVVWSEEVRELHELPDGYQPNKDEGLAFYLPEYRPLVGDAVTECAQSGRPFDVEARLRTAQDRVLWVRVIGNAVRNEGGAITHVHGSVQDISPQKAAEEAQDKLEAQLLQSQKLEAVGSLAGGVAHDFNNLLSVILSYAEISLAGLAPEDPVRNDLEEIRKAGWRAADLVRQLLAFSRKQVLRPVPLDLNAVVVDVERMLSRLLAKDVVLVLVLAPDLRRVHADRGQIEQVLVNLVVNARDAMPDGGTVTIETNNGHRCGGALPHDARSGDFLTISVTDTGIGMDEPTQARIFEPFFTTKSQAKGTGLGLSTVYGIIEQSGGHVQVVSAPSQGATFRICLPVASLVP